MYKFVPGDVLNTGDTNIDSVKRCLEFVVGKRTPTETDLMLSDFNMNGKIDLMDTLKVLQIAESSKKAVYIQGKNVIVDTDMIKGDILGAIIYLNSNNTFQTTLDVTNWLSIQNGNKIYIENILRKDTVTRLGTLSTAGGSVTSYEVVSESNGVLYHMRS